MHTAQTRGGCVWATIARPGSGSGSERRREEAGPTLGMDAALQSTELSSLGAHQAQKWKSRIAAATVALAGTFLMSKNMGPARFCRLAAQAVFPSGFSVVFLLFLPFWRVLSPFRLSISVAHRKYKKQSYLVRHFCHFLHRSVRTGSQDGQSRGRLADKGGSRVSGGAAAGPSGGLA